LLAQLQPDKVYSDLLESAIGAVLVDSTGNSSASTEVLKRFGLLDLLRRAVVDGVDVRSPKSALYEIGVGKDIDVEVSREGDTICAR